MPLLSRFIPPLLAKALVIGFLILILLISSRALNVIFRPVQTVVFRLVFGA